MRIGLFIILLITVSFSFAQKKPLIEKYDEVVAAALEELDQSLEPPDGELYLLKMEKDLVGKYTFVIQIHEKGQVASVFVKEKSDHDIRSQNMVKDFIKDFKFNFKMPKGKDYKFEYTINLS
jgi:hypothetical protein